MDEKENTDLGREEIFSKAVRAGKRTYFFDVKATISNEYYLTITESKRRFNNDQGKFFYEKHKLFLYKEDFEKFANGLTEAIDFITTNQPQEKKDAEETTQEPAEETVTKDKHTDINFDDLTSDSDDQ